MYVGKSEENHGPNPIHPFDRPTYMSRKSLLFCFRFISWVLFYFRFISWILFCFVFILFMSLFLLSLYYGVGIPGVFDPLVLILWVEPTKLTQMHIRQIWSGFKYKMWRANPFLVPFYQLPCEWLLLIINLMLWWRLVLLNFFSR